MVVPTAKELSKLEPWRTGQGAPRNALQMDWTEEPPVCAGDVLFDPIIDGVKTWWRCTDCGYCSCFSNILHFKPDHPQDFYSSGLEFFYARRAQQGLTHEQAKDQVGHLLGSALRAAAKLPAPELGRFIDMMLKHS